MGFFKEKFGELKLRSNLFAAIFCVLVALILWFVVQDVESPDYKKTFSSVRVEIQSLPEGYTAISGGDVTADVTLTGKRNDLNKLKAGDIEAYIDLSQITEAGVYERSVSVLLPEGTAFSDCFPRLVSLFVDETAAVPVPVRVELGEYQTGADISLETSFADTVTVKGPKTILETIAAAKVSSGNLGAVAASFEKNLEYVLLDAAGAEVPMTYLSLAQKTVKVGFHVTKQKTVPLTVEGLHGYWPAESLSVTLSPHAVTIKGEPALIDSIDSVRALTIDETTVNANRYTAKVSPDKLELPEGVSLAASIGAVDVSVTVAGNSGRQLKVNMNSSNVIVTPPGNGLSYSFDVANITLDLRGKTELISKASLDDFFLNIDLSMYETAGQRTVTVRVVQVESTKGNYYAVGTYTVVVNIY